MDKVKFGIIGTGMIAGNHAIAIKASANAQLVAVYDTVVERAQAFAEKYGCICYSSLEEFLASDIEAVTIGTPSGAHGGVAIAAANAGKHILCEKPLEVNLEKIDQIIDACEKNNVILSSVFQLRYGKTVDFIKRTIDSGRFGDPVLASASVRWYRTPEYYATGKWRGTWALDGGGALMNQGIHTVDLLLYFNGKVNEVSAKCRNILHKSIEVEDTVAAMLSFENGALGVLEASTACNPGMPRRIELSGTKGCAVLEDDKIVFWQFEDELPEDEIIRREGLISEGLHGGSSDPTAITCEGHKRQISELADAIRGIDELRMPGAEGRKAVELITAVYKSASENRIIKL